MLALRMETARTSPLAPFPGEEGTKRYPTVSHRERKHWRSWLTVLGLTGLLCGMLRTRRLGRYRIGPGSSKSATSQRSYAVPSARAVGGLPSELANEMRTLVRSNCNRVRQRQRCWITSSNATASGFVSTAQAWLQPGDLGSAVRPAADRRGGRLSGSASVGTEIRRQPNHRHGTLIRHMLSAYNASWIHINRRQACSSLS